MKPQKKRKIFFQLFFNPVINFFFFLIDRISQFLECERFFEWNIADFEKFIDFASFHYVLQIRAKRTFSICFESKGKVVIRPKVKKILRENFKGPDLNKTNPGKSNGFDKSEFSLSPPPIPSTPSLRNEPQPLIEYFYSLARFHSKPFIFL